MGKTIRNSEDQSDKKKLIKKETSKKFNEFKQISKEDIEKNRRTAYDYLF